MAHMLERRQGAYRKYTILCLGESRGNDPHEFLVSHVRYAGLTHSNIHAIDFDEEIFRGVFFFEDILQRLLDDVDRQDLQLEQEEKNKIL
jgi:hypothetical protein